MSRSVNSPLKRVTAGFCEMSSGILCGDLAKTAMVASGYTCSVFRKTRMPLGPVAPRTKKRIVDGGKRRRTDRYLS